jgi:hypothetical protein
MTTTTTTTIVDTAFQQSAVPHNVFITSHDPTFTEERHNANSDGDGDESDLDPALRDYHAVRHNNNNTNQQERIRKRKKPTLNCLACVDRKSKCDRARPSCLLW